MDVLDVVLRHDLKVGAELAELIVLVLADARAAAGVEGEVADGDVLLLHGVQYTAGLNNIHGSMTNIIQALPTAHVEQRWRV